MQSKENGALADVLSTDVSHCMRRDVGSKEELVKKESVEMPDLLVRKDDDACIESRKRQSRKDFALTKVLSTDFSVCD